MAVISYRRRHDAASADRWDIAFGASPRQASRDPFHRRLSLANLFKRVRGVDARWRELDDLFRWALVGMVAGFLGLGLLTALFIEMSLGAVLTNAVIGAALGGVGTYVFIVIDVVAVVRDRLGVIAMRYEVVNIITPDAKWEARLPFTELAKHGVQARYVRGDRVRIYAGAAVGAFMGAVIFWALSRGFLGGVAPSLGVAPTELHVVLGLFMGGPMGAVAGWIVATEMFASQPRWLFRVDPKWDDAHEVLESFTVDPFTPSDILRDSESASMIRADILRGITKRQEWRNLMKRSGNSRAVQMMSMVALVVVFGFLVFITSVMLKDKPDAPPPAPTEVAGTVTDAE